MAPHHSSWQLSTRPGPTFPAVTPSLLDKASCSAVFLLLLGPCPSPCSHKPVYPISRLVPALCLVLTHVALPAPSSWGPPCPRTLVAHTDLRALLSLENDTQGQPRCGQGAWSRSSLLAAPPDTAPRAAALLRARLSKFSPCSLASSSPRQGLPPLCLCSSPFTAPWPWGKPGCCWVGSACPWMAELDKGRKELSRGTASQPPKSCVGPCNGTQWVLRALLQPEPGQDLLASAKLLCVRAERCSFAPRRQSWRARPAWGSHPTSMAGRLGPASLPSLCCSPGLEAAWGARLGWCCCPGTAEGPRTALWGGHRTLCQGGHPTAALQVLTLHLRELWVPATSPAP